MSEFKEWRAFWGEVVNMWREKHGVTLANALKASFPLALLSFIGLLVSIFGGSLLWQVVSGVLLGVCTLILIFTLCFVLPYQKWSKDTKKRDARIAELVPLEEYRKQQIGHEEEWLHLVLEDVDVDTENKPNTSEDQVVVNFSFDSGLVYAFQPHRMWVSPTFGGSIVQEPQLEITPTPTFLSGVRSQAFTKKITIKDKRLLGFLATARKDHSSKRGLEVKMQFRPGEPIHIISAELH
jgi:hypothetical protein